MYDHEAAETHRRNPHLSMESIAYSAGRNAADGYGSLANEFTDPGLRAQWRAGWRSVKAEDALDADTEWDD